MKQTEQERGARRSTFRGGLALLALTAALVGCGAPKDSAATETAGERSEETEATIVSAPDAASIEEKQEEGLLHLAEREEEEPRFMPEVEQIRAICELSTLECYYHNVAKGVKAPGTGLTHIGERERRFWIEYTGIAEISFPLDQLYCAVEGETVYIVLPEPRVSCRVDEASWKESSYVISPDQFFQLNPITAEDQTAAVAQAQEQMQQSVEENASLMLTARQQARELIENYINEIGRLSGVEYRIRWGERADEAF